MGTVFLALLSLLAWRLMMPKGGLELRGEQTWLRIFFLLILYIYISFVALGLGRFLLKYLDLPLLTKFESGLLACLLGLSGLSAGLMILGLLGWLRAWTIYSWLAVSGILALLGLKGMEWFAWTGSFRRHKSVYLVLLQIIAVAGIVLLFLECLLPVWDYDALLYHLEVPRQFLLQGKFYFDSEVLRSAYPYFGEMLFLMGIAFDLDSIAKFVNFTYAILFVLSSYAFSHRFFGEEVAYTTVGIFVGAPAFWMWATWAGIDFAWASYEFWSVYAVSLWLLNSKRDSGKWLILAGVMSGLAASTKYLSIPSLGIVGALIAWKSVEDSKEPLSQAASNLLTFGLTAALVAGAWYIKNWLWTGNPVYPLAFGGPGWEPLEAQVLNDYVYSFGVGKSWSDFLLLPYNVYAFQDKFSTIGLEMIHPALWFAFLFPFIWQPARKYDWMIAYTIIGFVLWAVNSQVIRFLIPLTAFLSILAGAVMEKFPTLLKNLFRIGLIGGFMLFNLLFQIVWFQDKGSSSYLNGERSAAEYLQKMNYDFRAIQYVQESLHDGETALLLWDGRSYYCDARCVPDDEQSSAVRFAYETPAPQALARRLRANGITHVLLSTPDANWFITYHDPQGLHRQALIYFTDTFFPACGNLVYTDQEMQLFEMTCH